jgi:transposase InsO family protein
VHPVLAQIGIHFSSRTCGRIPTTNRALYGLEKPKGPSNEKGMPFAARRRHQYWTADVRYIDDHKPGGRAYVVSILDNHSRCMLSSAVTRTQEDLASYLCALYAAVERYGSAEAAGHGRQGVFRSRQARAVYEALGIATSTR